MANFRAILGRERALIGMVHVGALPGTPFAAEGVDALAARASDEARILAEAGFDAIIVENMHDRPYVHAKHGPEIVASMTRCVLAVRSVFAGPIGVQVLSGGEKAALAIALASGASFIRAENFVFSHVADEGLLAEACAGDLLRYRKAIGAEHVAVLADLKKKHASHALTADVTLAEAAHAAEFFGADGVIVTGRFTGQPAALADLREARGATELPVVVGSGVDAATVNATLADADAAIVGSAIKAGGVWTGPVDRTRCEAIVKAARP